MASQQEKEQSLRRLRLLIATHTSTPEEDRALEKAQQNLQRRIEAKCQRSTANQQYVFPRLFPATEEPAGFNETVNLKEQVVEPQQHLRPKIKLTKSKQEKRAKTEYVSDENASSIAPQSGSKSGKRNCDGLGQNKLFKHPLRQTHNTFRLQIRDTSFPIKDTNNTRSKLNLLSRSYAKLKTSQQHPEQPFKSANLATILKDRSMSQFIKREGKIEGTPVKGKTLQVESGSRERKGFESEKSWLKRR